MGPRLRFALLLGAFVALTALGVWWAAPSGPILDRTWRELAGLGIVNAIVLIAFALVLLWVEVVRLIVFGRVLGVRVGTRAAFDAAIANDLFSWISPGGMLGEPAVVYVMGRRGVPWDAALAISFAKFATSFALFMGLAGILVAVGYGPNIPRWGAVSIVLTLGFGVLLVGSFIIGAARPDATLRVIAAIEAWCERRRWLQGPIASRVVSGCMGVARRSIERLAMFRRAGVLGWLAMLGSHVVYYSAYIGLLVTLGWMFDARSLALMVPAAIIYQAFTYMALAPGLPEAVAAAFFGGLLSDGNAFVVVLLFRALTAYFQVALALVYLPVIGLLRSIVERSR